MALAAGAILSNYEVIALLGVGGRGEVYLGEDPKLSRKVALKFAATRASRNKEGANRGRFAPFASTDNG